MSTENPSSKPDYIAYYGVRAPKWRQHIAKLGVTTAKVDALVAAQQAAADAFAAQNAAAATAKAATATANAAVKKMNTLGAGLSSTIRGNAATSEDPAEVLALADLAPRSTPTPSPAPAAPTAVTTTLQNDGTVRVSWTGSVAKTAFAVRRRYTRIDGTTTGWATMDTDGLRPFVDATVPAGATSVSYAVRGTRLGKAGPWSESSNLLFVAQNPSNGGEALKIAA